MDTIELAIKETLVLATNKLVEQNTINNDTKWTKDIKEALHRKGDELGYWVYTSKNNDFDNTTNECLYDMIWYESLDGHNNDLNRIHLALESEWCRAIKEIRYDFYKLIQARAEHRVMIFQSDFNVNLILEELTMLIEKSRVSEINDRYLLAGWDNNISEFIFKLIVKGEII